MIRILARVIADSPQANPAVRNSGQEPFCAPRDEQQHHQDVQRYFQAGRLELVIKKDHGPVKRRDEPGEQPDCRSRQRQGQPRDQVAAKRAQQTPQQARRQRIGADNRVQRPEQVVVEWRAKEWSGPHALAGGDRLGQLMMSLFVQGRVAEERVVRRLTPPKRQP
jgi:hypothetical protein